MSVYRSYLSVVIRPSGYAIAILLPKAETYAVLGSSQLEGPYDPLYLLGYIIGLWDAAVTQPRLRQGLAPVGPQCLLCNQANDIEVINQMLKQTGGIAATALQPYAVTTEQTRQALSDLRNRLTTRRLLATEDLTHQLHQVIGNLTSQPFLPTFDDLPILLAAIAQVSAYEQAAAQALPRQLPSPTQSPSPVCSTTQPTTQPAAPETNPSEGWLKRLVGWFA